MKIRWGGWAVAALVVAVVAGLVHSGRTLMRDSDLAEAQVPGFHRALDEGRYAALYAAGAEELKKSTGQDDFVALLGAVHRKLGAITTSRKLSWHVNFGTNGTYASLAYDTQFERGEATEQFLYRIQGGKAHLAGYHIESAALVEN